MSTQEFSDNLGNSERIQKMAILKTPKKALYETRNKIFFPK
jgi:hypothetical protein